MRAIGRLLLLGLLAAAAQAGGSLAGPPADPLAARRAQCLDWLERGYPSGIEEASCTAEFALPSAFLVRCSRALRRGFASELERAACAAFLARESARVSAVPVRR